MPFWVSMPLLFYLFFLCQTFDVSRFVAPAIDGGYLFSILQCGLRTGGHV